MWQLRIQLTLLLLLGITAAGLAQDPVLPAANFGMANIQDGVSPGPGLYYVQYLQIYQAREWRNAHGEQQEDAAGISSLLSMHQLIYETNRKVLGGNLAFSALLPVVKLSSSGGNHAPTINPGVIGGFIFGPVIQWSDRKLLGLSYWHRAEIDLAVPAGAYNTQYAVNPSSRFFTLTGYYAFTLFFTKDLSVSMRHHVNYNFRKIDADTRAGMFYNMNYSLEQRIAGSLRAAVAGYYLRQFTQDDYRGDRHYYQRTYGIADTREQVLGIGPGISYVTKGGLAAEAKVFFETAARNRTAGVRPTLKVAYKLN
ncbi:SphA family protein [Chitinophaga solisilvae]|uniref:Uncharacterized protein n=1 Tax=Chitinophaga solisilvae TaxID=1233460 RepID=A0A3S1JJH0_9BACT|nr:transporter [Chitinophaga solisilvae]NSL87280.1 hypothetical protein [Chitinophaga solisilvae]